MLPSPAAGHVYIVGAGPGDPGLLTLKGARYLSEADVVLYDGLVDQRLLDMASPESELIDVGHRGGSGEGRRQEELNRKLVDLARQGKSVVRLKGGDPYVFGRGGEEAMALRAAGIPFEVVSGVSAASSVPAYAGIPLTHRDVSATAVLVTGHEDPTAPSPSVDWELLARMSATLVIFMGSLRLQEIVASLLEHGRAPDTPAAAIEWGTWPRQRSVASTLQNLAVDVSGQELESPTLIVVGDVVALREHLNWFEDKPLFGRRVLITRSREQSGSLQILLEAEGAEVSSLPVLLIRPPGDWSAMDAALDELADFDWVVFTSPNSVEYFFARLRDRDRDARALSDVSVAAVGLSTAQCLRDRGLMPDLIPQQQSQEGLAAAFAERSVDGLRFLIPASDIGRTLLDEELERRGALVSRVVAYENRAPDPGDVALPRQLTERLIDLFVFASPSSVRNFSAVVGVERALELLERGQIACIGPTTSAAVRELGLTVHVQPDDSSIAALVQAICTHYGTDGDE